MIDFVTVEIPCDLPEPIYGDVVMRHTAEGELKWSTFMRRRMTGSYSGDIHIRAIDPTKLEISGNPAKFLQGHNLWGPDDMVALLERTLQRVQPVLWPDGMPPIDLAAGKLSRVDVTSGFEVSSLDHAKAWLRAHHECANRPYMGRGVWKGTDGSTLVYGDATGKRAKAWQLTLYLKGMEVARPGHELPVPMLEDARVIEWVNRLIRAEVRLRTVELKRSKLRMVRDWERVEASDVWAMYVGKVQLMGEVTEPDRIDDPAIAELVKPRHRMAFAAWKSGQDIRPLVRSRSSWYQLRKDCREFFGVDITSPPPKSNVVPLRRIIEAQPAHRPSWADEVDRRLAARAA